MTCVFAAVSTEVAACEHVAIVVGAGGELGRATTEKLAAAGFTAVGVDRIEQGLKELPDGIRREAADPAAARSVVDRIAAEVGPPSPTSPAVYQLDHLPSPQEVLAIAEKWRPYAAGRPAPVLRRLRTRRSTTGRPVQERLT